MNRKCFLLLHMLGIALIVGACGAADDTTETTTEYVSKGYTVETGTSGTQQTETDETFTFSNKALGNLTEQTVNLIKNAEVYANPNKNAAQLGTLEKGTKVKVVGKTEKDEWLMADYNGRIAYIKADSIDEDERSSIKEADKDTGSDSSQNSNTKNSSTNNSNTNNSNSSNTNGGGTGNTVKKPSNTNSGNTGNSGSTSGNGNSSGNTGNSNGTTTPSDSSNSSNGDNGGSTDGTEKPSQPSTEPDNPVTPTEPDNSPGDEEQLDGE